MTPAPPAVASIKNAVDAATRRLTGTVTETPRLDAEVLMAFVLGWTRARLFAHWDEPLDGEQQARYESLVERRAAGEPVAYIRNLKEFLGLELYVDRRVLIPRPETELLVSRAVVRLQSGARTRPLVVDVGTGSGAIAIGIAKACPEVEVIATDISADALAVAAQNASRHGVELDLRRGSLLEPIAEPVDLIVANLPYLSRDEYASLQGTSISYEPRIALTDEEDGLRLFDELLSKAPAELKKGGAILLEIGSTQPRTLQALAKRRLPNMQAAVFVDYAGHARVLELSQR